MMNPIYTQFLSIVSFFMLQAKSDPLIGTWKSKETKPKTIYFTEKDGFLQGKIVMNDNDSSAGGEIKQLIFNPKLKAYEGEMSPPGEDKSLKIKIMIVQKNELKLILEKFYLSKTIYFTRVQ
ncbi:MAG: hypothetical protein CFE23_08320 [Flavobacterium sp. BFFFF1]|uniref:hypothetical protein n=1 Tax=Flavobacterium sp. BFFFF1 TaxID=2015557 RepID=UPI000BD2B80C|nr:hypothetical protein [Flavobacterium sp. BFFFF1]OYU80714.1 MAG: hypothetical protein CFE23_08320 [Flavobacterium sp. BFFFF1]